MRPRTVLAPHLVWTAVVSVAILGPLLLSTGYWLYGDMVFVPRQPWKPAWLGLDGGLPRAVPMDAVVSVVSQVVPGWLVQRGLLLGGLLVGGVGAARLTGRHSTWARVAAVNLFLWNPWVCERLAMGQWAILCGYLLLPWVALAAAGGRHDLRGGLPALWLTLAASAVCSPSSGLMAGLVAVVIGSARRHRLRSTVGVVVVTVAVNLPWLLPTALSSASTTSTSGVFASFSAHAESAAGTLPSLLSLGGTWKSSIVPPERTSALVVLFSCALTVVALAGLRARRCGPSDPATRGLLVVAALSLVLAAVPTTSTGADLLEEAGRVLPGVAVLRDSHRFLAPAVLALVPGLAGAVDWVIARGVSAGRALLVVAAIVVAAPLLLLPSLAWGDLGGETVSHYPAEWQTVRAELEHRRVDGDQLIVLPWAGSFRAFSWDDRRAVLDPAPRYFPGDVLIDDSTILRDRTIPAEDPRVVDVTRALRDGDPSAALAAIGVRWVLVEKDMSVGAVPTGSVVHDGPGLELVELAPGPATHDDGRGAGLVIWPADLIVMAVTLLLWAGQVYILLHRLTRGGKPGVLGRAVS